MAQARSDGSSEYYEDVASFLSARKTLDSSKWGFSIGIAMVQIGLSGSDESHFLSNISQYANQNVGVVRLVSTVQTAQFKMRSRDLVLHEDMLQSLMELPEEYDFGSYAQLFNKYGTHHITDGTMGGVLEYVLILNKEAMEKSAVHGKMVGHCFGVSIGLTLGFGKTGAAATLKAGVNNCEKIGERDESGDSSSSFIRDAFTLVKGGTLPGTAGVKTIRDANAFKTWGKSLKYSPDLIDFETIPVYELVRFSTAADQAKTRLPHLRRAWEEYEQQYSACRCAPCRHNGVPVLTRTSCSCECKSGYRGEACEETYRQGSTDGSWSCWGGWSSCQSNKKTRTRACNNPQPAGGAPCLGNPMQTHSC
ncbi:complement component C8 alpha chain [Clupea harengus]|uniref:Complement component C8 alpha chain n=1 Tax=Clupea harengus TaxID=7950 RepID=A0A6P8F5J4_CLUHA|nr:complement component C8 alpha chain [Clupea harengus]